VPAVTALTLDTATSIAAVIALGLAAAAVLSLWLVHSVVRKLLSVAVLGLLAFAVWTQRAALQDCADKVATNLELASLVERQAGDTATGENGTGENGTGENGTGDAGPDGASVTSVDTTCSLFGVTVDVP
jgi:uncharacterized membrane protein YgcG